MRHSYLTRAGTAGDRPLLLSAALHNKTCGCRLGTVEKKLAILSIGEFRTASSTQCLRYDDNLISFLLCLAVDEGWVEVQVDEVGVGGLG